MMMRVTVKIRNRIESGIDKEEETENEYGHDGIDASENRRIARIEICC